MAAIDRMLRGSVEYGFAHPAEANAYIRAHSQEMSEDVCAAHIKLYVNSFSLDLGREGEAAITTLLSRAETSGLVPRSPEGIFISRT